MYEIILQDEKNGKVRPWREKKQNSLKVSDSYMRLGQDKKAKNIRWCSSSLSFEVGETGSKTLCAANFCKERLCPMCQWRKSLKVFWQVSRVMDVAQVENRNHVPLFLTLTVKNCYADGLKDTVSMILNGWYQFTKHSKTKNIVQGWFRALEITYNQVKDEYHPHLHVILMVDKSYFVGKYYMQTAEWVQLWRTAAKLEYDPVCDIRKVKQGKEKHKAVAEVAKYVTKDKDYILEDLDQMDEVVDALSSAMYQRQLFAFGGTLKKIARRLNVDEVEDGDLVHIDEDKIRTDVAKVIETYDWNFGAANFVRRR
jgi:plasmid rolling circle replication initiator protein Rep